MPNLARPKKLIHSLRHGMHDDATRSHALEIAERLLACTSEGAAAALSKELRMLRAELRTSGLEEPDLIAGLLDDDEDGDEDD